MRFVVGVMALVGLPAWAQPQPMTLPKAIDWALHHQVSWQMARLGRQVDAANLAVARNTFDWQVKWQGQAELRDHQRPSWQWQPGLSLLLPWGASVQAQGVWQPGQSSQHQLTLRQPLLRGVGTVAQTSLNNALDQECINRWQLMQQQMDTVNRVILAYRQVLQDREVIRVQRMALARATDVLHEYEMKVKAGQMPRSAKVQQQTQVLNQRIALANQANALENDRQRLLLTLGLDPKAVISLSPALPSLRQVSLPSRQRVLAQAKAHNVLLRMQRLQVRQARRRYDKARNEQLWDVALEGKIDENRDKQALLSLRIPVRDQARRAALVQAHVAWKQAAMQVLLKEREVMTEVSNAWRNAQNQRQQVSLAEDRVSFTQKNYRMTLMSRLSGRASAFEVVSQQQRLVEAQLSLIQLKISYLNSVTHLEELEGMTLNVWHVASMDDQHTGVVCAD